VPIPAGDNVPRHHPPQTTVATATQRAITPQNTDRLLSENKTESNADEHPDRSSAPARHNPAGRHPDDAAPADAPRPWADRNLPPASIPSPVDLTASSDRSPGDPSTTAEPIIQIHGAERPHTPPGRAVPLVFDRGFVPNLRATIQRQAIDYVRRARLLAVPESVRFEVDVQPPELGRLRISVTESEEGLVARISANHHRAFQLLEQELPALHQSLQQVGMAHVDVEVSHGDGSWHREHSEQDLPKPSREEALGGSGEIPTDRRQPMSGAEERYQVDVIA